MKLFVFALMILGFVGALTLAVRWDSGRYLQDAHDLMQDAQADVDALQSKIQNAERDYARFSPGSGAVDPTDPLARRAADELAGARNRLDFALKTRRQAQQAFKEAAMSWRGRIGQSVTGLQETFAGEER